MENEVNDEQESLAVNKPWVRVKKPSNRNILQCKWVFSIKYYEFGNPYRYKERLVAKGFSQEYLSICNENLAPVARISTLRFIYNTSTS